MNQARKLKDAGNKAFAAKNINAAVGAYSMVLEALEKVEKTNGETKGESKGDADNNNELNRLRAEVLSNRSLCLGKLKDHAQSLTDAKTAIASDPTFAKGYLRFAQALLALKRPKEAADATKIILEMEPEKLKKQVEQLLKKCRKMLAPTKKNTSAKTTTTSSSISSSTTTTQQQLAPEADVHTFAQQLVTAALSCGIADPSKSKFEGSHLTLSMVKDGSEKRLHVATLFDKYKKEKTFVGRARCLMKIVSKEIVGFAILPHDFEIAKHLLRPRLFSRQKLDASGSTSMPENDGLPCWMLADGSVTTSNSIQQADAVAVAVVVDYGKDGMLPVMKSTLAAWNVSFDQIRTTSMSNFKQTCIMADVLKMKKKKTENKETWKSHMSGCLTSPWIDNTDGARIALFPELYVPEIPLIDGQAPRALGISAETVAIFGTNNCVLISEPSNPISQCFVGDIVMNDMESTVDHVSSLPYRLVRGSSGKISGKSGTSSGNQKTNVAWAWRPYCPNVQRGEFSIPSDQSEIDSVLDAVQSGGKKRVPIFGATETTKEGVRKNIETLQAIAKTQLQTDSGSNASKKSTAKVTETELKTGFLGNDSNKSVLNDSRRKQVETKKKQKENDAKSVDGLNGLNGKGFFNKVVEKDVLVELADKFDGKREGCAFRLGTDGLGYYKDVQKKIVKMEPSKPKSHEATIDLGTLNRSIGMFGNNMSNLSNSGSSMFAKKKSLFSL